LLTHGETERKEINVWTKGYIVKLWRQILIEDLSFFFQGIFSSVDVNGNATCTCDGNWNGTYCEGMLFTREIINSSHGFSKTSIF
jgi:hypothetical protein